MIRFALFTLIMPAFVFAKCSEYYFSLDFGGRIGDGPKITQYLVDQKVPHMIFMVGKNLKTESAKELCQKLKTDPAYKKYVRIGNHSYSHKGFVKTDNRSYIESEIMGNEAKIKALCGGENFVKIFRYPKGQSHPIAEQVLAENDYTGQYSSYTKGTEPSDYGVGWTADTKDWLEEGAASIWAQKTYYERHKKFMAVTEASIRELKQYAKSREASRDLASAISRGKQPEVFNNRRHTAIEGWHGPTTNQITEKILNDSGVDGKCVPLAHYGGYNTLAAFKKVIPELKRRKVDFKHFDDGLRYVMDYFPSNLDPAEDVKPKSCSGSHSSGNGSYHIVSAGETLFAISRMNGISVEQLKRYNSLSSNEIEIGQKLMLQPVQNVHYVQAGETLFSISREHGVSVELLKFANGLGTNEIDIGQKLEIPSGN